MNRNDRLDQHAQFNAHAPVLSPFSKYTFPGPHTHYAKDRFLTTVLPTPHHLHAHQRIRPVRPPQRKNRTTVQHMQDHVPRPDYVPRSCSTPLLALIDASEKSQILYFPSA